MANETFGGIGSGIDTVAQAVIQMEGSMLPNSINMSMVRQYGLWNVGHLIWAGQIGAQKVWLKDRYWAGWPSQSEAYAGLVRDLSAKARAGYTIEQAFRIYAPPSENDTGAYIAHISASTGYPSSTPLASVISGSPAGGSVAPPFPGNVDTYLPADESDSTSYADSLGLGEVDPTLLTIALGLGAALALSTLVRPR